MKQSEVSYIITTQELENIKITQNEIEQITKNKRKGKKMINTNNKYENWNDYLIEGTDILKNIPNIKNQEQLKEYEKEISTQRLAELIDEPIQGEFDKNHLYKIHQYLFQDIYEWAGQTRTVSMKKQTIFLEPEKIDKYITIALKEAKEDIKNIKDEYQLADYLSKLFYNLIFAHPFREGNGRTIREFIRQLINSLDFDFGSYDIDYSKINQNNLAMGINCSAPMFITPEFKKSLTKKF